MAIADAVVAAPTPEEKKAPSRVDASKRRNKKQGPEDSGQDWEAGRFCDATDCDLPTMQYDEG